MYSVRADLWQEMHRHMAEAWNLPEAAALAQEAELTASGELQPSREDVAEELSDDEFDRAVDAGSADEQQQS